MNGRGWNRDRGEVHPYNLDSNGNIISPDPPDAPHVNYGDYETVIQRYVSNIGGGVCPREDDTWCSEVDINVYDSRDLNRVLGNYNKFIQVNPSQYLSITEFCNDPADIEFMEDEFNIDSELICDKEYDCSEPGIANLELLCPNGEYGDSNIFNPLKVLCEKGISCSFPDRCISTDETVDQGLCDFNINNEIYASTFTNNEEACHSTDGCLFSPATDDIDDEVEYFYPCILYSNRCKDDTECNRIMIDISNEVLNTGDITQNTFRECRNNQNCINLMDCSLMNIRTNILSIEGQCEFQDECTVSNHKISWPCITKDNLNYYRCTGQKWSSPFDQSNCYCAGVNNWFGAGAGIPEYHTLLNARDNYGRPTIQYYEDPLCMSTYNGLPFCYTNAGDCIDGRPSEILDGYDWSYDACDKDKIIKWLDKDNYGIYLDGELFWNNEEPGGYWNHYVSNNYGFIEECDRGEIYSPDDRVDGCFPCGTQTGCLISDLDSECLHLVNKEFGNYCSTPFPSIIDGYNVQEWYELTSSGGTPIYIHSRSGMESTHDSFDVSYDSNPIFSGIPAEQFSGTETDTDTRVFENRKRPIPIQEPTTGIIFDSIP